MKGLAASCRPSRLLLTDVVLRAMSGPEMVRLLRERGLELAVVYMSGYPADFVESRVQLSESEVLVHKPFTAATLISALRQRGATALPEQLMAPK
jgi:two-component system, cell cycle sensor histidine kinase and response regulator CckA